MKEKVFKCKNCGYKFGFDTVILAGSYKCPRCKTINIIDGTRVLTISTKVGKVITKK